jgi:D-amino-acid oxidase
MPFHCDDPRTDRWALETLDELLSVHDPKSSSPHVEQVPTVVLKRNHHGPNMGDFLSDDYKSGTGANSPLPSWSTDRRLDFQHLTVEMLCWQNRVHRLKLPTQDELTAAGYKHAWLFRPPVVDCPKMLEVSVTVDLLCSFGKNIIYIYCSFGAVLVATELKHGH